MCLICKYNQVKTIDRALLTGVSLTSLNKQYGFSLPDLQYHQKHLRQKMAQAQTRFHDNLRQGLFCKLNLVMEMVLGVVRGARAGEDFKLFLQASREFTRIIGLMPKMAVPLDQELLYCLMSSAQWDLQDNLLPDAFQALAATRQSLKVNLFAPCPEPEPEIIPALAQSSLLETKNLELETPHQTDAPADPRADLIQEASPGPARQPFARPKNDRQPPTDNRPKNQREISAKLAPKTSRQKQFNE